METPRSEHPKPQFQREGWKNLNGYWDFAFDLARSGDQRGLASDYSQYDKKILVPFCPESELSGIGYRDFIPSAWYHRSFTLPEDWTGQRIFLHFGAVDYESHVWVNNVEVGQHFGGSSSFSFDITHALKPGENDLTVWAIDDTRSHIQPSGKQSEIYPSNGCYYTRVTGIWQTVWLEARPAVHFRNVQILPDLDRGRFALIPAFSGYNSDMRWRAIAFDGDKQIAATEPAALNSVPVDLVLADPRPWSPSDPYLYDLVFEIFDDAGVIDRVQSHAGLRKIHIEGNRIFLNNAPIFLRLVLDQGFYPEGVWTAPSDQALRRDIEMSMAAGFNGARLHQKVFEERFHYWADRLGYLTWGENADWGGVRDFAEPQGVLNLEREWFDVVRRDRNHPSIICWTPLNETISGARQNPQAMARAMRSILDTTRAMDPTRPINDTSGFVHACRDTDLYTVHNYEQDPAIFAEHYKGLNPESLEGFYTYHAELSVPYQGQPFVVSEYGGSWWSEVDAKTGAVGDSSSLEETGVGKTNTTSWGYGRPADAIEEIYARMENLTAVLVNHPHISGFCYTQLTDVEQEQNGIYTFDRRHKFDAERLRAIFSALTATECKC